MTSKEFKVIVVDNNSADESVIEIIKWASQHGIDISQRETHYKELFSNDLQKFYFDRDLLIEEDCEITLVKNGENSGFAGGCNVGILYAFNDGAENFILLNNDTEVREDYLENLLSGIDRFPDAGLLGSKILYADKKRIWYAGGKISYVSSSGHVDYGHGKEDDSSYDNDRYVTWTSFCSTLIKKPVIEDVGLLDRRFFLGSEDSDYCLRASKVGYKCAYIHSALVYHISANTYDPVSPKAIYYVYRGKVLFAKKSLSRFSWFIWHKAFYIYMRFFAFRRIVTNSMRVTGRADDEEIKSSIMEAFKDGSHPDQIQD